MVIWFALAAIVVVTVLGRCGTFARAALSGAHVVAHITVGGRGLYYNRTPDGVWGGCGYAPAGRSARTEAAGASLFPEDADAREPDGRHAPGRCTPRWSAKPPGV